MVLKQSKVLFHKYIRRVLLKANGVISIYCVKLGEERVRGIRWILVSMWNLVTAESLFFSFLQKRNVKYFFIKIFNILVIWRCVYVYT